MAFAEMTVKGAAVRRAVTMGEKKCGFWDLDQTCPSKKGVADAASSPITFYLDYLLVVHIKQNDLYYEIEIYSHWPARMDHRALLLMW